MKASKKAPKKAPKMKAKAKAAKPAAAAPAVTEQSAQLPNAFALIRPALEAIKTNTGTVVGLVITPIIASVPVFLAVVFLVFSVSAAQQGVTGEKLSYAASAAIFLVYLAMTALAVIIFGALTATALKCARGERIRYGKAWAIGWRNFWRLLGLYLCMAVVVLGGLVLVIVPGLYMLRRYMLAPYYLLDRNMGVFEAMRQSASDSQQYGGVWDLVFIVVAIGLFSIIPSFGWVLSLIGSVLVLCVPALRYLEFSKLGGYSPAPEVVPGSEATE